jgi:hypothetical protein
VMLFCVVQIFGGIVVVCSRAIEKFEELEKKQVRINGNSRI